MGDHGNQQSKETPDSKGHTGRKPARPQGQADPQAQVWQDWHRTLKENQEQAAAWTSDSLAEVYARLWPGRITTRRRRKRHFERGLEVGAVIVSARLAASQAEVARLKALLDAAHTAEDAKADYARELIAERDQARAEAAQLREALEIAKREHQGPGHTMGFDCEICLVTNTALSADAGAQLTREMEALRGVVESAREYWGQSVTGNVFDRGAFDAASERLSEALAELERRGG